MNETKIETKTRLELMSEYATTPEKVDFEKWVRFEAYQKDIMKEHDKVVAYWEKVYDKLEEKANHWELSFVELLKLKEDAQEKSQKLETENKQLDELVTKYRKAQEEVYLVNSKLQEQFASINQILNEFNPEVKFPILGNPAIFGKEESEREKGYSEGFYAARETIIEIVKEELKRLRVVLEGEKLTPEEIVDVEASEKEIREGKCKTFKTVDALLKDLKGENKKCVSPDGCHSIEYDLSKPCVDCGQKRNGENKKEPQQNKN